MQSQEVKQLIEANTSAVLSDLASIGVGVVTLEDDAFNVPEDYLRRMRISDDFLRDFVEGENLRDWSRVNVSQCLFPYDGTTYRPVKDSFILKCLWPFRTRLRNRKWFRQTQSQRGLEWFEYGHIC